MTWNTRQLDSPRERRKQEQAERERLFAAMVQQLREAVAFLDEGPEYLVEFARAWCVEARAVIAAADRSLPPKKARAR